MSSNREWNLEWPTDMIVTRRRCNKYLKDFGFMEIETIGRNVMKKTGNNHGKDAVGQEH